MPEHNRRSAEQTHLMGALHNLQPTITGDLVGAENRSHALIEHFRSRTGQ